MTAVADIAIQIGEKLAISRSLRMATVHVAKAINHSVARPVGSAPSLAQLPVGAISAAIVNTAITGV